MSQRKELSSCPFFPKDVITLTKKSQETKPLEFNAMSLEDLVKKMAPLLKGKDGRDGKDGKDGRDGRDGLRVRGKLLKYILFYMRLCF